ncbi:MAG: carboxy terminal-processing peptidase [Capsulimonadales bacterium]|nr:carboxy terminal-processing peptidase [Capsulimonadales bacterium]
MNQPNKKVFIGAAIAFATLGVTGAVVQSQSAPQGNAKQDLRDIARALASTGGIAAGDPGEALTIAARRFAHSDSLAEADDAGKAAFIIAQMLATEHYSRTPVDEKISSRLFDQYIDNLDPGHFYFLASDIAEFEKYRPQLGEMLKKGDLTPSRAIAARFRQRVADHMAFAKKTLANANFNFNADESFSVDRKKAPFPANEEEQQKLWLSRLKNEYLLETLNQAKPGVPQTKEAIVKKLDNRYHRLEKMYADRDENDTSERYLSSLMHVYDPHSDYRGKANTENFNIQMRLSLVGIGAQLQADDEGYVKIMELIPGGPAIRSKQLKPGDRITAVAQGEAGEPVDVVDMKTDKVVELIRGKKGTVVRITVIPADAPDTSTRKTVTLVRDQIRLEEQAAKGRIFEIPSGSGTSRIGYIELPSFYGDERGKSATADVNLLLKKMEAEKVQGIILDLRRNGGGLLEEAISLTGLFIKSGPVVQVKDSSGQRAVHMDNDPAVAYDGPLVVMTSRLSASASEIVAGALQDYGRAVIVGDSSTFGKGTVQSVMSLGPILKSIRMAAKDDPGSLTLTIRKFYRPSGASTQLEGVKPDIQLPSVTDVLDIAEKSLDNPLPWDTIAAANFAKVNRVQPVVETLRQRTQSRIASDKEFALLKEQVELARKVSQEKTVSLNLARRKAEKTEAEARSKRWKAALAALPVPNEKIYTLSLEAAVKPGLPPAQSPRQLAETNRKAAENRVKDENEEEDVTTAIERDVLLDEAKRIALDYVALMKK